MSKDTVVLATRVSSEIHDTWKFLADSLDEKPSQLLARVVQHVTEQKLPKDKFQHNMAVIWLGRQWGIPVEIRDLFVGFRWDVIHNRVGNEEVRGELRTTAASRLQEKSQLLRRSRKAAKVVLGTRVPSATARRWKELAQSLNMKPSQLLSLSVEYILGCGDWREEYFEKGAALLWLAFQWGVYAEVPEFTDQPWNDFQFGQKTPPNVDFVREAVELSPNLALQAGAEAEEKITSDCVGTTSCIVCKNDVPVYQGKGEPKGYYLNCKSCGLVSFLEGPSKKFFEKKIKRFPSSKSKKGARKKQSRGKDRRSE